MFQTLSSTQKLYPKLLHTITNFPEELYVKGALEENSFELCVGVVGSRRMTSYGSAVIEELVSGLVSYGVTVVSGFMYGVDITAHLCAIKHGGKTIAVMPCGIDLVYPSRHWQYYEKLIASGGLIISEYLDDLSPRKWMFLERNRIVAGISMGVLVVEAAEHSGSIVTANFALEFGRKLFAVPGSIFSATSRGANVLIKRGGHLVNSVEDIVVELGLLVKEAPEVNSKVAKGSEESKVLSFVQVAPKSYDQLLSEVSQNVDLRGVLMRLELAGLLSYRGGYYYVC